MKKLITPLAVGAVCAALTLAVTQFVPGCERVVEKEVYRYVTIPADTVTAPGRTIYKTRVAVDTVDDPAILDTIATLRARLYHAQLAVAQYEAVSSRADFIQQRRARIARGADTTEAEWTDRAAVEHFYPPIDSFTLVHQEAVINLPPDTSRTVEPPHIDAPLPDWLYYSLEAVKVLGGIAIGYFSSK